MRVALVTPYYESANRGNAVAAIRWERGLGRLGEDVRVFSLEAASSPEELSSRIRTFSPDVVHGIHAYRSGGVLLRESSAPVVVSMRGTDVWHDLQEVTRGEVVRAVLERAARITVLTNAMGDEVRRRLPGMAQKLRVIPQGVEPLPTSGSWPFPPAIPTGSRVIIVPANLRRVKNLLTPLTSLAPLVRQHPFLHLVYVGPVIEEEVLAELGSAVAAAPWAAYLGSRPHEEMGDLLAASFAVLNPSRSEGMSNAILEGMAMGKPVLAFRGAGSEEVIRDGENGFLFETPEELTGKIGRLLSEPDLARRLGENARVVARERYSWEREAAAYRVLYREVAAAR